MCVKDEVCMHCGICFQANIYLENVIKITLQILIVLHICFQEQSEKQLDEKLKLALEERDIFWQEKMAEQERSHAEMVETKASALVFLVSD